MAQYYADFSLDTPGDPPVGWTQRWVTSGSPLYTTILGAGYVGGQAVRFTSTSNQRRLLSNDAVDADLDRANAEVLVRFRADAYTGERGAATVRGRDVPVEVPQTFPEGRTGYSAQLTAGYRSTSLELHATVGNTRTRLATVFLDFVAEPSNFIWVRLRADGDQIKAKAWFSGDTEPVAWSIEVTDATVVDPGWCGVSTYTSSASGATLDWDVVSIATDGETAAFNGIVPSAAEEEASQVSILTTTDAEPTLQLSQVTLMALGIYPAEFIEGSQVTLLSLADSTLNIEASQVTVMVAARGRTAWPKLRAWTYTLDGHDYYVLQLGDDSTLVYDFYSQQWFRARSGERSYWRVRVGQNWKGSGAIAEENGSNVVVGDDTFGVLYILDPLYDFDDDVVPTIEPRPPVPFARVATGQIVTRTRDFIPCYEVFLTASFGEQELPDFTVTLEYSDDRGETFNSAGDVTLTPGDYDQEVAWRSLGQISAPGRFFRITDYGGLIRIDSLDINTGEEAGGE